MGIAFWEHWLEYGNVKGSWKQIVKIELTIFCFGSEANTAVLSGGALQYVVSGIKPGSIPMQGGPKS